MSLKLTELKRGYVFYLQSYSAKINKYIHVFWLNYFLNVCPRNLLVSLCIFTWFKKTMSTFIIKIKGASGRRSFSLQPWLKVVIGFTQSKDIRIVTLVEKTLIYAVSIDYQYANHLMFAFLKNNLERFFFEES